MTSARRPIPYVQSAASLDVPPPYHFPNVTVNSFVWEMEVSLIKHYCDTYLNLGAPEERGYTYRPAVFWPYANLMVLQYPVMIATGTYEHLEGEVPYCDRGTISQTEVFVALPVMRYGKGPLGLLTESALEWALPLIVVGNPISSVCGREMLGLGKLLADIECGEGKYPGSFETLMKLPGWRDRHADTMQELLPILSIETAPTLPTFRRKRKGTGKNDQGPDLDSLSTLMASREMGWVVGQMQSASNFVDQTSLETIPTEMRTIGLKQYRDAGDPGRAVYQALVSCRSHYANIRNFQFYDEDDVIIEFIDNASFREVLKLFFRLSGEPQGEPIGVPVKAGFRFEADIDFDQARIVREVPIRDEKGDIVRPGNEDISSPWFRPWRGFFANRPAQ